MKGETGAGVAGEKGDPGFPGLRGEKGGQGETGLTGKEAKFSLHAGIIRITFSHFPLSKAREAIQAKMVKMERREIRVREVNTASQVPLAHLVLMVEKERKET